MNMDLKELMAKIQNYVDPILGGIIALLVLNLVGGGLAYYVTGLEIPAHPVDPVRVQERPPYEPFFVTRVVDKNLPDTYAPLLRINFFKPTALAPIAPDPTPPPDPDGTRPVSPDTPPPPAVKQTIDNVIYHGGVLAANRQVAQLSTSEAGDGMVYMVRAGSSIPGTDIRLDRVHPYYVVLSRPGYETTNVPVKGAVTLGGGLR